MIDEFILVAKLREIRETAKLLTFFFEKKHEKVYAKAIASLKYDEGEPITVRPRGCVARRVCLFFILGNDCRTVECGLGIP